MLLSWLGQRHGHAQLLTAAALIETAVDRVLDRPASRTRDVGGSQDTSQFSAGIIAALQDQPVPAHFSGGGDDDLHRRG
jgi:isocitrate/isopropylmalate dehydrogenase